MDFEENLNRLKEKDLKVVQTFNSQLNAVVYAIQNLNIEMVDSYLDNQRTYQDFEKSEFIQKLTVVFNEFKEAGDTYLEKSAGICNSFLCKNTKCKGTSFVGNNSYSYIDLILDIENDVVVDIFECSVFVNDTTEFEKKNRILLDKPPLFPDLDPD